MQNSFDEEKIEKLSKIWNDYKQLTALVFSTTPVWCNLRLVHSSMQWCKSRCGGASLFPNLVQNWCKFPNLVQWCNSLTKSSEIITVDCSGATLSLHYGANLHLLLVGWWYMSPIIMTRRRSWIDFELIVYSDAGLEFCTSGTTEWWVSFALLYFTAKSRNVYDITLQKFCHICVIYKITLYVHIMELLYSQFIPFETHEVFQKKILHFYHNVAHY